MLTFLFKSVLPHRVLYPQRRRFRDRSAPTSNTKRSAEPLRLAGFLVGGLLLATVVLLMSAAFRAPSPESHVDSIPTHGPAAAIAAGQATAVVATATDGRAVSDLQEAAPVEKQPEPIIATIIDPNCAAHAREKLMVGLTNYYLQRRLRPGATSDDAAETSILTGVLAGPGDPAATTPETSCQG
jgi:hypothetical protein